MRPRKGVRSTGPWLPGGLAIGLAAVPAGLVPRDAEAAPMGEHSPMAPWAATMLSWGVGSRNFAHGELYTWTTAEQVAELRRDKVLFTREESPTFGVSHFDRVMIARERSGDPLAAMLRAPAFARARYAWPNPWATLLGWGGETYGDRLIPVYEAGPRARPARVLTWARGVLVYDRGEAREVADALRAAWP